MATTALDAALRIVGIVMGGVRTGACVRLESFMCGVKGLGLSGDVPLCALYLLKWLQPLPRVSCALIGYVILPCIVGRK